MDNSLVAELGDLGPSDFYEGVSASIFAAIQELHALERVADPVTVLQSVRDPALAELGGPAFLAALVDKAPTRRVAFDYAQLVHELANRRAMISVAESSIAAIRNGETSATAIAALESSVLAIRTRERRTELLAAGDAAAQVLADLDAPDATRGISTGLKPLDDHLGQLQADDLVLLAARPSMGKSALAACIGLNVARTGVGVIEVNSEMTVRQMTRRHLCDLAFARWGPDAPAYRDLRRGTVTPRQREMLEWAAAQLARLPLVMVKRTGLTLGALRSLVRRQAASWESAGIQLGLASVDHVGLLQAERGARDRYQDQTAIAIGLKVLADELHVPILALVQLSRRVEDRADKRPMLADLRDTGAWEENADIVIGLYRDAYYAMKEPEPADSGRTNALLKWSDWDRRRQSREIEALLLKVREGEEGVINLWASIGHNAIRGRDPEAGSGT
jgi:replicative DNA helicase